MEKKQKLELDRNSLEYDSLQVKRVHQMTFSSASLFATGCLKKHDSTEVTSLPAHETYKSSLHAISSDQRASFAVLLAILLQMIIPQWLLAAKPRQM